MWTTDELISFDFDMTGSVSAGDVLQRRESNVRANVEGGREKPPLRQGLWKRSEASVNSGETTTVWLKAFPHIPAGV